MKTNEFVKGLRAKLDHIGIAVNDLEVATKVYEMLGLELEEREVVPDQGVEVAMLPAGDTRIELLCPMNEASPVAKYIEKRGEGLHHIALQVSDIRATMATCVANDIRLIDKEPRTGAGGKLIAFIHPKSTGGVLLELTQDTE